MSMDANAIHAILGADGWRNVLLSAGLTERQLKNKHGPCPGCGGSDRYRFDNKRGRGDFYCNQCGSGDGFALLMRTHGLKFVDARKRVMELAGLAASEDILPRLVRSPALGHEEIAKPTRRVLQLLRETCAVEDCGPAITYLRSRSLWPLPHGHSLKAHPSVEYWQDKQRVGRFPALVAAVRDSEGELVTAHITYLEESGEKLKGFDARKLLSGMAGREGCAVPLMKLEADVLGIAEGIETALSAAYLHNLPVWAALNTSLLQKFEPPIEINKLVIFADRDVAGLDAATKLMQRLQEKVRMEIRTPQAKDWNDVHQGDREEL